MLAAAAAALCACLGVLVVGLVVGGGPPPLGPQEKNQLEFQLNPRSNVSNQTLPMFHALLMFCVFLPGQVTSQAVGAGSYAGYRVRQNCDPAGGTAENERIDATLNFALCCAKAGTGPKAELSPCCNNCVEQFALYCTCVFCVVCVFLVLVHSKTCD